MHNWPSETPTPELVASWVTLGVVASDRAPLWAAHWLVQGHDGEALRALAGLGATETREVHDLLPAALAECGVTVSDSLAAAARVTFGRLARMCVDEQATERWLVALVYEIVVGSDYHDDVFGLPLAQVYGLQEEWDASWGRPRSRLAREIRDACQAQLATAPVT